MVDTYSGPLYLEVHTCCLHTTVTIIGSNSGEFYLNKNSHPKMRNKFVVLLGGISLSSLQASSGVISFLINRHLNSAIPSGSSQCGLVA